MDVDVDVDVDVDASVADMCGCDASEELRITCT